MLIRDFEKMDDASKDSFLAEFITSIVGIDKLEETYNHLCNCPLCQVELARLFVSKLEGTN